MTRDTEADNLYRQLLNERRRQSLLNTIKNTKFNFTPADAELGVWGANMNREGGFPLSGECS